MITIHQFVERYPIEPTSRKLILGTIHPHYLEDFEIPFFYGNKGSIWKILNKSFPGEMADILNVNEVLRFLSQRGISISDTVLSCRRKNPTALDKDLIPLELNYGLVEQIANSNISKIFFTSGIGKNNAFKLFYVDILGLKLTSALRRQKEFELPPQVFGRPLQLVILPSPSGSSNIGISRSAEYRSRVHDYAVFRTPVQQFKIDKYRSAFEIEI